MGKSNKDDESMEVVENKSVPGNGLTDTVSPSEGDALNKKDKGDKGKLKGVLKKGNNRNKENINMSETNNKDKIDVAERLVEPEDEDPGPSVSDNESDLERRVRGRGKKHKGHRRKHQRKDVLGSWAHKCRLTPKRGLIYILFCAVLIVFLIFILFLLVALWPRGSGRELCQSSQCHLYSAQIVGGLNSTIGPCDDYWEYSCGGWLEAHPLPKSKAYWDAEAQQEFQIKERLRSLLNTLPLSMIKEPNSVPLKMKRFYDSCMGLDYIDNDGEKDLLRVIKTLGGWNVLRDFRSTDFDFPRLLRKIQGDYRASPFFHIGVVPDPSVPSRNIIKISPAGLSLPHRSYYFDQNDPLVMGRTECPQRCRDNMLLKPLQKFYLEQRKSMPAAFRTFAKDVVQLLGANSYQGDQFAVEIFNFEKRIAEVTPDPRNLTDPVQNFHKITVAELKSMSNTIFWGDLLKALFSHGNVIDQTEIVTPSLDYLVDVSSVISTTDKGNLNNYLMWHLTQKYLPYLSRPFTEVYEMFRKESIGSSQSIPRWEFCATETIQFFPHGTDFLLSNQNNDNNEKDPRRVTNPKIQAVEDMFERMRQTLMSRVNTATKFDESMRNFLLDKLRLVTIQTGTPIQNKTILEEMYFSVQMQKFEFFANVQSLTEFQSRVEQKNLAHPNKDTPILSAFSESPFKIQYLPSANKVIVPQSILEREILRVGESQLPLLFGSIGVQVAEALATAFGPERGLYFSNGALMPERDPKVQELRDIINSRRSCLSSFFTNIRLDDEPYIDRTSLDTTLHLAAIQISLDTLKTHDVSDKFQSLPGLDYPPEALFFLAYGQSQCSVHTMLYHDLEHTTFTSLSHDHRTRGVLRQFVPFTEAFECSKSSEMYADFSCGYII